MKITMKKWTLIYIGITLLILAIAPVGIISFAFGATKIGMATVLMILALLVYAAAYDGTKNCDIEIEIRLKY